MSSIPPYLHQQLAELDRKISEARVSLGDPELKELALEEITKLEAQKQDLQDSLSSPTTNNHSPRGEALRGQLTTDDDLDSRPAIIEIRAAAGGEEAKIWASDLLRMYTRYCDLGGFKYQKIDDGVIKVAGNQNPYGTFKYESGVHRVQRVPTTEASGRIHTSTATVAVLPEISEKEVAIKNEDLDWQFTRSGGPGGQNVNKLNTAVRLTHKPTGLVISVRQERFQQQNKEIALQMLRNSLWEIEEEKRLQTLESTRKSAPLGNRRGKTPPNPRIDQEISHRPGHAR
ncbi:MAG: PCRF domain-containing protein [Candidatus Chisholmbacteria bacterium]|nr:PCRF domain-containing protein [Candidatus Chisholmbacteria bacterium]